MDNANELAFPLVVMNLNGDSQVSAGLTKRELFAAMAMQGMLANSEKCSVYKEVAEVAVLFADVLLAELAKVQS